MINLKNINWRSKNNSVIYFIMFVFFDRRKVTPSGHAVYENPTNAHLSENHYLDSQTDQRNADDYTELQIRNNDYSNIVTTVPIPTQVFTCDIESVGTPIPTQVSTCDIESETIKDYNI